MSSESGSFKGSPEGVLHGLIYLRYFLSLAVPCLIAVPVTGSFPFSLAASIPRYALHHSLEPVCLQGLQAHVSDTGLGVLINLIPALIPPTTNRFSKLLLQTLVQKLKGRCKEGGFVSLRCALVHPIPQSSGLNIKDPVLLS